MWLIPGFHPVTYKNCTMKIFILSRYTSVASPLTTVHLFEIGLPGIL